MFFIKSEKSNSLLTNIFIGFLQNKFPDRIFIIINSMVKEFQDPIKRQILNIRQEALKFF